MDDRPGLFDDLHILGLAFVLFLLALLAFFAMARGEPPSPAPDTGWNPDSSPCRLWPVDGDLVSRA